MNKNEDIQVVYEKLQKETEKRAEYQKKIREMKKEYQEKIKKMKEVYRETIKKTNGAFQEKIRKMKHDNEMKLLYLEEKYEYKLQDKDKELEKYKKKAQKAQKAQKEGGVNDEYRYRAEKANREVRWLADFSLKLLENSETCSPCPLWKSRYCWYNTTNYPCGKCYSKLLEAARGETR